MMLKGVRLKNIYGGYWHIINYPIDYETAPRYFFDSYFLRGSFIAELLEDAKSSYPREMSAASISQAYFTAFFFWDVILFIVGNETQEITKFGPFNKTVVVDIPFEQQWRHTFFVLSANLI